MTKARDLANIISGGFTVDDIPNLPASKITSGTFADARIAASNVSQHATSFDDNKLVNDISTLALRQASDQNKSAYNTNSQSVDVFQDATGIDTTTNVTRNASEYVDTNSIAPETGGTSVDIDQLGGFNISTSPDRFLFTSNSIQYNQASGNHLFYSSTAPLTGNYRMTWKSDISPFNSSTYSTNAPFQIGIGKSPGGLVTQTSLYNDNNANTFYVMHSGIKSSGSQTLYFMQGQSNQGSTSITFDSSTYLQLVRDSSAGTLKLYASTSSLPYTQSGSLLHTFSNYSGSQDDVLLGGIGYTGTNMLGNEYVMQDATVVKNITAFSGGVVFNSTGNFTGTTITAPSSVSSMGAIITYQDQAGTNALNTDIVLQLSADGGSNYSTATLTALPDFSTGIKMAKVNDLAVTAGTQLKYKINFANQASGTKEARIRGVALQY